MDAFTVESLSFTYPEQERSALRDLSFSVPAGQFLTLCGPSGCGKTTLLRQLKPILSPHGARTGRILFQGRPLEELSQREQTERIGFVLQSTENQLVTDKVWHELAFGLESLGLDTPAIRARVAEMASFFGIESWFYKNVTELSGGQKQLLNLASVMALQPAVLLLDEPTSQLDPIAAGEFIATIAKINRELGTTIILSEHRLEDVLPLSDRALVMDQGGMIADGSPAEVGAALREMDHAMFAAMPTPMRIWAAVENDAPCPITVREGRNWLEQMAASRPLLPVEEKEAQPAAAREASLLTMDEVWFKYEKEAPDVVKGLGLHIDRGEFVAILGGNGAGKSTALSLIAGLNRPYRGQISLSGRAGMLPQNPQALFVKKTVREDLDEALRDLDLDGDEKARRLRRVISLCRLESLLTRHPYDLSGGEQQRAALAKVLLRQPELLLLDEPTKGLDAEFKQILAQLLLTLAARGMAIVMVSHDVEFCAAYATRCALFFDGHIVSGGDPRDFFSGNSFYTTAANRMARELLPRAVVPRDVILSCGGAAEAPPVLPTEEDDDRAPTEEDDSDAGDGVRGMEPRAQKEDKPLPWWRRLLAVLAGLAAVAGMINAVTAPGIAAASWEGLRPYLWVIGAMLVLCLAVSRKSRRPPLQTEAAKRKLSRRTKLSLLLILLAIPLTLFLGAYYLGERKYYFISLLILLETMLPFALVFEGRSPQARELVIIAVLCGLGVAGRAAFFMLPQFKPVTAIVIIAGVAFGGETGFLVGALTMLVSNMLFSQGPWTPWQMVAMGIIGFLAGVLFRKGWLRRGRLPLSVFGALAAVIIYGGIMNPASALMWQSVINWQILLAYYATGFPFDLVHAIATFIFLWLLSEPLLEKLDRIKVKYGLVE